MIGFYALFEIRHGSMMIGFYALFEIRHGSLGFRAILKVHKRARF